MIYLQLRIIENSESALQTYFKTEALLKQLVSSGSLMLVTHCHDMF